MTNKIFSKTVRKTNLWAVILTILVAAAIVICAIFGFNQDVRLRDSKTLTVSMNAFFYNNHKDEVLERCEKQLKDLDAKYTVEYSVSGETDGDVCEIIFVFEEDTDMQAAKEYITDYFDHFTDENTDKGWDDWVGGDVDVSTSEESVTAVYAKHFVLRTVLAGVVFAVLAFAYVSVRYKKWTTGLFVGGSVLLSMLLTSALLILTRIPVTHLAATAIAMAGLLTAVLSLMFTGKMQAKQKEGFEGDNEALVLSAITVKESIFLLGGLAVAMLLVGITGRTAAAWFALAAIVGLLASAIVGLIVAPAAYLSLKTWEDGRPVKGGYVGAKKISKKQAEEAPAEDAEEVSSQA